MGILGRIADWLESKVHTGAHRKGVGARVLANAAMGTKVLRFQGRYECGCPAPPGWETMLVPDYCPNGHDAGKVYEFQDLGTEDAGQVSVPREIFN
jgi:hypothetical protein